jgi:hypothetical protein
MPVLLIIVSEVFTDIESLGGGWNILSYLIFFISGYIMFSNSRIQENIKRYSLIAFLGFLVLQVVNYLLFFFETINIPDSAAWTWGILAPIRSWLLIIAILGFGSRYLNFNNRFLGYANEAVLPFYILHQTVILIIGFFVIQWSMGITSKYFTIATTSFLVVMAIYEFLIKRIKVIRFLFGMRWNK